MKRVSEKVMKKLRNAAWKQVKRVMWCDKLHYKGSTDAEGGIKGELLIHHFVAHNDRTDLDFQVTITMKEGSALGTLVMDVPIMRFNPEY